LVAFTLAALDYIDLVAFFVTIVWAITAVRLLAISGKGAFEASWKYLAIGAILIALATGLFTISDLLNSITLDDIATSLLIPGGVFMALALRGQHLVWRKALSSKDSRKILESFAISTEQKKPNLERRIKDPVSNAKEAPLIPGGKKVIFEFDPTSEYEEYIARRVKEISSSGSEAILFTKQGSTLSTLDGTKMVVLSFSEHAMKLSSEGNLSVSITNPSLILDAFTSIINSNPDATIIIDTLTDLILNLGFEKTYNLLQEMNEKLVGDSSLLLLFNPKAHDEKLRSIFEGYANVILRFDRTGLQLEKGNNIPVYAKS
jgi:hypothetical protein